MGIDPGLTRCGYAVLHAQGSAVKAVALGVIRTPAASPLPQRLAELKAELVALLNQYRPHAVAVEQVFFQTNVRTAMSVGQASGLALAEAAAFGCDVVQFTPNQVKDSVTGWGAAPKEQVQRMVQARLGLAAPPRPADAADAAALAWKNGIEPHAGHGLTYENVVPVAAIPQLAELNIGHYLIGEAIFDGLENAVRRMRDLMDAAR